MDKQASAADWVSAAIESGLHVVAVTDHDSADRIPDIQADSRSGNELTVFPGVELTSSEGVHLLVLFDRDATADAVKAFMGACGVPQEQWGTGAARATKTFSDCMEIAAKNHHGLCIAPHADAHPTEGNSCKASLLVGINDNANLERALSSPYLAAVEVCGSDDEKHKKLRGLGSGRLEPGLSLLRFSDAHSIAEVGRRSTWIKMTQPDLEGLRLAYTDGERSTRVHDSGALDPNQPPGLAIEELAVSEAKHFGRSEPFVLRFNPWLNALIGGRGTGKSSLVELTRLVLDRNDGLPPAVQEVHANFAKVYRARQDPGALTPTTRVTLIYRKDGTRFRASWKAESTKPTLEEEVGEEWKPAEGSVRRRLPVQVYSQNEINEIAKTPRALLKIVNESSEVDYDKWDAAFTSNLTSFLALRAHARDLEASLAVESEARGELADTSRQIEAFEGTEHDKILKDHQRFQKQERAIERWEAEAQRAVEALEGHAQELGVDSLSDELFDQSRPEDQAITDPAVEVEKAFANASDEIKGTAARLNAALAEARLSMNESAWATARDKSAEEFESLSTQLDTLDIAEPGAFDALLQRRQALEEQLGEIDEIKARRDTAMNEAAQALQGLEDSRQALSKSRAAFLGKVLGGNRLVQVELAEMGDRVDASEALRELLGTADSFGDDVAEFVNMIFSGSPISDGLKNAKAVIRGIVDGESSEYEARDKRFITRVKKLTPEALDRLDAWFPEDLLHAKFRRTNSDTFEPIDRGSTGQQNAAILAFLLSYGDEPIIIDQPENDLDNRLISDLVVRSLAESKKRRQLVVVTHNPNLVVNGDAEFVVSLDIPAGEVKIETSGGLQEELVREEVCDVMEGGRKAFELRYSRIGRKSTA